MRLLEDVLAEEILSGRLKEGSQALVDIGEDNQVVVIPGETRELIAPGVE